MTRFKVLISGGLFCQPTFHLLKTFFENRVYQKEKLDQQLDMAAKSFVNQEVEVVNDPTGTKKVLLTKLLLWYKNDFGQTDNEVLEKLSDFITDDQLKNDVKNVIMDASCAEKIMYRDYNWTINKL